MSSSPNDNKPGLKNESTLKGQGTPTTSLTREGTAPLWPSTTAKPQRFTQKAHREALGQSIPAISVMPFAPERNLERRVMRLVSTTDDADLNIDLKPGINRIGRQREGNHIVLVSPQVSRAHAEIEITPNTIVVRDLNSGNGTFVNGNKIREQAVNAGDILGFSEDFSFRLLIDWSVEEPTSITLPPQHRETKTAAPASPEKPPTTSAIPSSLSMRTDALKKSYPDVMKEQDRSIEDFNPSTMKGVGNNLVPLHDLERHRLEQERHQLAVLHQVTKRCITAQSLSELDGILVSVLERVVSFDRGFIAYQLPSGDWKIVFSPKGESWDRALIRDLLQRALTETKPVFVDNSQDDARLGQGASADQRLLCPLIAQGTAIGTVFLLSTKPQRFSLQALDFLTLFSDVAAIAIVNCGKLNPS